MSLKDIREETARRRFKQAQTVNQEVISYYGGQPAWVGDRLESYVEYGVNYNPDVYSIIAFLERAASQVTWSVYEVTDREKFRKYKSYKWQKEGGVALGRLLNKAQAMEQVYETHLNDLLENPNPLQSFSDYVGSCFAFEYSTGNDYTQFIELETGANAGRIQQLWKMPAQFTEILTSKGTPTTIVGYQVNLGDQPQFEPDKVMHWKLWNLDWGTSGQQLYGMSPLRAARKTIAASNEAYNAQTWSFFNMGARGLVTSENGTLTETQQGQLQDSFDRKFSGSSKTNKTIFTSAQLKWQQIGMSPVDLAIIESQRMNLRKLCALYGLDSKLFNDPESTTYNNVKEARKSAYLSVVLPALDSFRDMFNKRVSANVSRYEGRELIIDYDLDSIPSIQEDLKDVADRVKDLPFLRENEKRQIMGYESDPVLDVYMYPMNLVPFTTTMSEEGAKDILEQFDIKEYD